MRDRYNLPTKEALIAATTRPETHQHWTDTCTFRCRNAKESCEEAVSGDVIFDHFEDISGKTMQTDGYYELKFSTGRSESGIFKVTCFAPCG